MAGNARDRGRSDVSGQARLNAVLLCALVALCAAVLAGLAWTRSATRPSIVHYRQSGSLSYSSPAGPTSIYGSTGLVTGQPVYETLITTLHVTYTYQLESSSHATLHGTEQLVVTLNNGHGLTRTLPLQPPTPFQGTKFTALGTLHLSTLQAIVTAFNQAMAGSSSEYSVSISPHVTVRGHLASAPLRVKFNPATVFSFTSSVITPTSPTSSSTATPASTPSTTTKRIGQPLVAATSGSVTLPSGRTATLFAGLTVINARISALAVLCVALGIGAFLGLPLLREARSDDERARINTKFGSNLVAVASLPTSALAVVELQSFDGLAQVGRQLECPLLHLHANDNDEYAVVDNGTVYRYRIDNRSPQQFGRRVRSSRSESPQHVASNTDGGPAQVRTS